MGLLYRYCLALMPLGLALWLLGMHLHTFELAGGGILVAVLGAYTWTDDQGQKKQ